MFPVERLLATKRNNYVRNAGFYLKHTKSVKKLVLELNRMKRSLKLLSIYIETKVKI